MDHSQRRPPHVILGVARCAVLLGSCGHRNYRCSARDCRRYEGPRGWSGWCTSLPLCFTFPPTTPPPPVQSELIKPAITQLFEDKPAVGSFVRRVIAPLVVDDNLVTITTAIAPVLFGVVIPSPPPHPATTAVERAANLAGAARRRPPRAQALPLHPSPRFPPRCSALQLLLLRPLPLLRHAHPHAPRARGPAPLPRRRLRAKCACRSGGFLYAYPDARLPSPPLHCRPSRSASSRRTRASRPTASTSCPASCTPLW